MIEGSNVRKDNQWFIGCSHGDGVGHFGEQASDVSLLAAADLTRSIDNNDHLRRGSGYMAFPDLADIMFAVLNLLSDGTIQSAALLGRICDEFKLTEIERTYALLPESRPFIEILVGYAILYLSEARFIRSARNGRIRITDRGRTNLANSPPRIDFSYLMQFREFKAFARRVARVNWPSYTKWLSYHA